MPAKYTDDDKRRARAIYERDGVFVASQQLSIPVRTIRDWAKLGSWTLPTAPPPEPVEVAAKRQAAEKLAAQVVRDKSGEVRLAWNTRRRQLADRTGEVAAKMLERISDELDRTGKVRSYSLRDLAVAYGILVDKAAELAHLVGASDAPEMPEPERKARTVALVETWIARERAANE